MTEKWRTAHVEMWASVYVALGVAWLTAILWVVVGNVPFEG